MIQITDLVNERKPNGFKNLEHARSELSSSWAQAESYNQFLLSIHLSGIKMSDSE